MPMSRETRQNEGERKQSIRFGNRKAGRTQRNIYIRSYHIFEKKKFREYQTSFGSLVFHETTVKF